MAQLQNFDFISISEASTEARAYTVLRVKVAWEDYEYSFKHALVRDVAISSLLPENKRKYHQKIGEAIERFYPDRIDEYYELLAHHYKSSADYQKALEYLIKAGDKSKALYSNQQAIEYYNQALELIDGVGAVPPCPPVESVPPCPTDDVGAGAVLKPAPTRGHIYQSLGEIYYPLAKHEEALECFRKALEFTTDKKRRARIYGIMGLIYDLEVKHVLALEHLKKGVAELGDDPESLEMARICTSLSWVKGTIGNAEEAMEIALRGLKIVEGTEHYFEIAELYDCLVWICGWFRNDVDKAQGFAHKSVEAARKSGNSFLIGHSTFWLGRVHTLKSEDDVAIKLLREAIENFKKIGDEFHLYQAYEVLAVEIYQKRGDFSSAIECLEHCLVLESFPWYPDYITHLAWAYFQRGDAEKAIEYYKALEFGRSDSAFIAQSLGVMEESFAGMGKRGEFIPYCKKLREEKGESLQGLKLSQWYLEPKELSEQFTEAIFLDDFDQSRSEVARNEANRRSGSSVLNPSMPSNEVKGWQWINPRGDCSYGLTSKPSWLEIRATSGCDLWSNNLDAPRLLQEISGDFAIETKIAPVSEDIPTVGGLSIWKDKENFIRFERGMHGKGEIGLSGNVGGEWAYFGRGMLASEIVYLRLERIEDRFSAYCSSDGSNWLTCGEVSFPAEDPIQVGIHAIGAVGMWGSSIATATRFDYFKILRRG